MPTCHAHNRDGTLCKAPAVAGYPVCRMHGAGSPHEGRPGGRPIVHGAYSKVVKREDIPTLEKLRALGVGLEEEVAVARLQLSRALAWADAERPVRCDGKQCPHELVDSRLSLVSRVALRCQRIAEAGSTPVRGRGGSRRIDQQVRARQRARSAVRQNWR
jgi:hypothetical protein